MLDHLLITGGSGMVGTNIPFGYKPSSKEMDVTNLNSIEKYIYKLDNISCIIHLAAVNLRESHADPNKSIDVNINGTTNMLSIAMKLNIPFVLLSTGAVFSSTISTSRFCETSTTCPNCVYGFTKESAERVSLLYNKTIIIRTGWLFGGNQKTHYKFVENVINNLNMNTKVMASNNFVGSPTYVVDLIEQMKKIILNSEYGIHHVVNDETANGYDIAMEIANITNTNSSLIEGISSELVPNAGPQRSKSEVLETEASNKLRSWKIALKEYVNLKTLTKNADLNCIVKNSNTYWSNRKQCRLCNSYNLNVFFNLEPTPLANHFVTKPYTQDKLPLDVCICSECSHIQLIQIVDPKHMYSDYFYVSSTSDTMVNHLKDNAIFFTEFLGLSKNDNILEIGANDGVCVKHLLDNGYKNTIGVDPAANINIRHNLPIICDYFGSHMINSFERKFKLIYAFHCCAHIENIQDVFKTIYEILEDDGSFIMEVGYFYEVLRNTCFDTIYHEHIDYHTCKAIQRFSLNNNLTLYKVKETPIQGGSIQFFFSKNIRNIDESVFNAIEKEQSIQLHNTVVLNTFKTNVIRCGKDINYILCSLVKNGKKIAGYGASAKSTTFMHQFNFTNEMLEFIIDDNIYKQNFYSPGLHFKIKPFNILDTNRIDYILILSWNFTNEIVKRLEPYRKTGLRIIIPFPEIRII
jgi:dTDP-4-dehydrorhamnose reductase